MNSSLRLIGLLMMICAASLHAQNKKAPLTEQQARDIVDHLKWHTEPIPIDSGRATVNLAPGYRFLDSGDTSRVMSQLWENLPSQNVGMIFPDNATPLSARWAILIKGFEDEGYVKDDDAAQLDPDKELKELQDAQKTANEELAQQGLPQLELLGWASKPNYERRGSRKCSAPKNPRTLRHSDAVA